MAHEKWFISDTHFFHANILKFVDSDGQRIRKEFNTLDQMHSAIIKNWNAVVSPNDYVYHLGDVTFQYHEDFISLMSELKGKKRLILGNHDKAWNTTLKIFFPKVGIWKGFSEKEASVPFTASHFPLPQYVLRNGKHNVHGHIHRNKSPEVHQLNVSVEAINYTPIHIDTITGHFKEVA